MDLTWKQSFLILVDSEIFGQCSLYQFELTLKRLTSNQRYLIKIYNVTLKLKVNIHSKKQVDNDGNDDNEGIDGNDGQGVPQNVQNNA